MPEEVMSQLMGTSEGSTRKWPKGRDQDHGLWSCRINTLRVDVVQELHLHARALREFVHANTPTRYGVRSESALVKFDDLARVVMIPMVGAEAFSFTTALPRNIRYSSLLDDAL